MHVALPMQGTGEQGQQLGVSLKAEGGRCVSHGDHPLRAPDLPQDLGLPLIGHTDSEHKPVLWEDVAKEVMSELGGAPLPASPEPVLCDVHPAPA